MKIIGTVSWFGTGNKPWGDIRYNGTMHTFVHYTNIGTKNLRPQNYRKNKVFRELKRSDVVEFELGPGFGFGGGTQALNVEILYHADNSEGLRGGSCDASAEPLAKTGCKGEFGEISVILDEEV